MANFNTTNNNNNKLQEAFLSRIVPQLSFNADTHNCLFTVRYHPQHQGKKLREIARIIKNDYKISFDEAGVNILAKRVNDKILKIFQQEIKQDGIIIPENRVSPYQITYQWLWTKKFPRMGWKLIQEIAKPAFEELNMIDIDIEGSKRGLGLDLGSDIISSENDNYIKIKTPYRLHINLPIQDKYLLLINESEAGEFYLISPSKAFANIPYTILSEELYLPPDDNKKGRAPFLRYTTTGNEYFWAIVTEQPIELSWIKWESDPRDIILNQERLEEIFIKIGQQSNSEVFYRLFRVV